MPVRTLLVLLTFAALLAGCSSPHYTYHYVPGKTATIEGGYAVAPESAPPEVHAAIAAGNRIAGLPYRYGGGRCEGVDSGYDCSGACSYVLREAGLLRGCMTSHTFRDFARRGEGDWITVWARKGHVFLTVAGLRFDTGWHGHGEGPRWTTKSRPAPRYVLRHPAGL